MSTKQTEARGEKRGAYKKPSKEKIEAALWAAGGVVAVAAQKCNVNRRTFYRWMEEDPTLEELRAEIRESNVDVAEAGLIKAIQAGDLKAIMFFLRTQGKERGYSDRFEVSGRDGGPIDVQLQDERALAALAEALPSMTPEQRAALKSAVAVMKEAAEAAAARGAGL